MIEPFKTLFQLRWTNKPFLAPLPPGISRTFIHSSDKDNSKLLELLVAEPASFSPSNSSSNSTTTTTTTTPILFLHGGFGCAAVYNEFQTHFATHYTACTYALSLRGHGASYSPSFFKMVYMTGLKELASDLSRAMTHIHNIQDKRRNEDGLIIAAHSSGGGLLQYALANKLLPPEVKIKGIVLLDAVPNFGNISVYANWAAHDPWFSIRMYGVHLGHVASPLSSDSLIKGAFFGGQFEIFDAKERASNIRSTDTTKLARFRALMTPFESLLWPLGMMSGWWDWIMGRGGKWLDTLDVLRGLSLQSGTLGDGRCENRKEEKKRQEKVCVVVGTQDKLMDVPNQRRMVGQYRRAISDMVRMKEADWDIDVDHEGEHGLAKHEDGIQVDSKCGVRFVVVEGAGHHVQNDLMWEKAAEQVRTFALNV